ARVQALLAGEYARYEAVLDAAVNPDQAEGLRQAIAAVQAVRGDGDRALPGGASLELESGGPAAIGPGEQPQVVTMNQLAPGSDLGGAEQVQAELLQSRPEPRQPGGDR